MKKLEDLQRRLSEGRISRREFIGRATALGLAAAIPLGIRMEEAKAAEPMHGGRLRQAVRGGATSDSLEGAQLIDTHNLNTSWQVRSNLTEVTADGDVTGELAESWEPDAVARVWAFKLRQGVEFHNGKTLDANDVVYSINAHRGPDSKSGASGVVAGIEDLKADGDNVIFTLEEGNADFPFLMSDYHLVVAPAGTEGPQWDEGIGTGPYLLTAWEPGVRSASKRNPNYFKEGLPYFDEVETLNVIDVNARTNSLRTGEVDAIEAPELKTLHLLENAAGLKVVEASANKHSEYIMNMSLPPFDNNDVRLALKYAIDRNALLNTVLRGHGYLGNDHPIGRGQKYFAKDIPQRELDLDKARFHLQKAGLSQLDVALHAADAAWAGAVDGAILFKEHAAPAGINIEVVREPGDGYWSNVWMQKPFVASYWSGRVTEDWMFSVGYAEDAAWNETFWKHDRFNVLLKAARAELDETRRGEMYAEMQLVVRDEGGVVVPVFANFVAAASANIGTPEKIGGNWPMDGAKNFERWWFV
jgi:peptide/nickel transport system substrate-binding protein